MRGGARKGAGRPKGSTTLKEPTKALPRVPISKWTKCFKAIEKILGINEKTN